MIDTDINTQVWEELYSQGKSNLVYPNSFLVSLSYYLMDIRKHRKVLDYGFGAGANMVFLARRGFDVAGVEVSASALEMAKAKLAQEGLEADLRIIEKRMIPFEDDTFDAIIAWQVLYYNTWDTLKQAVAEIDRVLKPGGVFIGTMGAPGDVSHYDAVPLGDGMFQSQVPGQEGAVILIVEEGMLPNCFPGKQLRIGSFNQSFEGLPKSHHWVISYEK